MGMARKQLLVRVSDTPEVSQSTKRCIEQVAHTCELKAVACENYSEIGTLMGFENTKHQLAVACMLHWLLQPVGESEVRVFAIDLSMETCFSLVELLKCEKTALESPKSGIVKVLNAEEFVQAVLAKNDKLDRTVQIVDCREPLQYLGLANDNEVSGHLNGAVNVPFANIFTASRNPEDADTGDLPTVGKEAFMLSVSELRDVFRADGIDPNRPIALVSSKPEEAAAVATALLLGGQQAEITFCTEPLTDRFVKLFPSSYTTDLYDKGQLLYKNEQGGFDLSSELHEVLVTDDDKKIRIKLEKAYNGYNSGKASMKREDMTQNLVDKEEIVWVEDGRRYFDMPSPISKVEFLDVSRTIFRVVSFVLAPFGFPDSLHEKRSLQEVKTQCGSLFQDVLEVCSDLIYQEKGLNEGAMAMSVHKWVEENHDRDCTSCIKAINELWDVLYTPPSVLEVPDLTEDQIVALATNLEQKMLELVNKRAPWAFESVCDEKEIRDDEIELDCDDTLKIIEENEKRMKEQNEMDTKENNVDFDEEGRSHKARSVNEDTVVAGKTDISAEVVSDKNITSRQHNISNVKADTKKTTQTTNVETNSKNNANAGQKRNKGWDCMYLVVVYALGYIPRNLNARQKKLSSLQIKSFIQAVAEASWEVIKTEPSELSQIEFQALCETLHDKKQEQYSKTGKTLYVLEHFLNRSLKKDEILVDELAGVREAIFDGDISRRSGRYQIALAAYSKSFEFLPLYHKDLENAMIGRARCFIDMNELGRAKTEALIALKLNPYSVGAYECLGSVEDKSEHPEAAMQHYVSSFILDGSRSADLAESIDRTSRRVGRGVAKALFAKIEKVHEMPSAWLVESYFESFEHDADYTTHVSIDIAEKEEVVLSKLGARTLLHRAIYNKRRKMYGAAQRDIWTVVAKDMASEDLTTEERAVALNLYASLLYVAGDVHTAIEVINESLKLQQTLVNSLIKKGGFLAEIGEKDEAILCFSKAMELDPNEADVHLHFGQMKLLDGNFHEAVQCLRRCISRSDALPMTHVVYGMALYKSGSTHQAKDVFDEASKKFPGSAEVHLFYGEVLADQGNYANAMRHFLTAWKLSPQCPLPFLNAGRVYVSTNDPLRAIVHFKQALKVDPRCSSAHLDIAQILFAQGRTDEAFEHFEMAASCCRFLPEVEEVCACQEMAKMQLKVTEILGVELRHIMRSK
ncbi:Translocase of outer mitochondrial membrane complex, subunit TOM70/TOM72 [Plasmopara halstedii]|uniref:Translocase of outer mitochondrial membrane complex, subunit TOM70/TOM72 n=1 Tax=Plasmopara halstedii TaxID=4781 RepID=A0A0P1A674_PLAHL|nr:Translocase of outer mitochondrial membrane complex, subunit TOM70/TOM72 [Plasmopara halstedii]CEG35653.1 Translocase of outer mitochondrial membrane complex, subunit TOM70/TOM72 [Plasmopara halstedii]|eukprot:XP_024572022.1 Translocase of outer mitochondrial membrane complex, subunit TOM70/TOM72 [Plasmopara halstedii]